MGRLICGGALLVASALLLSGCAALAEQAAARERSMLRLSADLAERRLQTRRFETRDEQALLRAGGAVLQDLGFILESDDTELGVLVGSKIRTAVEARQVIPALIIALLLGVNVPTDRDQKLRVSLVTRPAAPDGASILVRVTFQRTVWNDKGMVTKMEPLNEPHFYSEFFELLSKAVYLEAHDAD